MAAIRTSRAVSRCRGVDPVSSDWICLPMRPRPVAAPVATTSATPCPLVTRLPEKIDGRSSPPGRSSVSWPPAERLRTGTDSPVSSDSSAARFCAWRSTPSAGTRSPSATKTMSPRTTSRLAMRFRTPSRRTSARGLDRSRSAASAARGPTRSPVDLPSQAAPTNPTTGGVGAAWLSTSRRTPGKKPHLGYGPLRNRSTSQTRPTVPRSMGRSGSQEGPRPVLDTRRRRSAARHHRWSAFVGPCRSRDGPSDRRRYRDRRDGRAGGLQTDPRRSSSWSPCADVTSRRRCDRRPWR